MLKKQLKQVLQAEIETEDKWMQKGMGHRKGINFQVAPYQEPSGVVQSGLRLSVVNLDYFYCFSGSTLRYTKTF